LSLLLEGKQKIIKATKMINASTSALAQRLANTMADGHSSTPLETFTSFRNLPREVRHTIWNLTIHPRLVQVRPRRSGVIGGPTFNGDEIVEIIPISQFPAIFYACHESRKIGLETYELAFGTKVEITADFGRTDGHPDVMLDLTITRQPKVYFNFLLDTLYLQWRSDWVVCGGEVEFHAFKPFEFGIGDCPDLKRVRGIGLEYPGKFEKYTSLLLLEMSIRSGGDGILEGVILPLSHYREMQDSTDEVIEVWANDHGQPPASRDNHGCCVLDDNLLDKSGSMPQCNYRLPMMVFVPDERLDELIHESAAQVASSPKRKKMQQMAMTYEYQYSRVPTESDSEYDMGE
jgi:hypothetical protein